jgi:hypothetical protein
MMDSIIYVISVRQIKLRVTISIIKVNGKLPGQSINYASQAMSS